MPKLSSWLKDQWTNLKSLVLAIVTVAVLAPIIMGILWFIPIIVLLLGIVTLFLFYKLLMEDDEEEEQGPIC